MSYLIAQETFFVPCEDQIKDPLGKFVGGLFQTRVYRSATFEAANESGLILAS